MNLDSIPSNLLRPILMSLFVIAVSAWSLYYRDYEAERLLELRKRWGYDAENDSIVLKRLRVGILLLYSTLSVGSLMVLIESLFDHSNSINVPHLYPGRCGNNANPSAEQRRVDDSPITLEKRDKRSGSTLQRLLKIKSMTHT